MKRTIRLKESELKNMISESVRRVLREMHDEDYFDLSDTPDYGGGPNLDDPYFGPEEYDDEDDFMDL